MKTLIEENQNITSNSKQLDILKKNFPQCFDKNGNFQPEKMNEKHTENQRLCDGLFYVADF